MGDLYAKMEVRPRFNSAKIAIEKYGEDPFNVYFITGRISILSIFTQHLHLLTFLYYNNLTIDIKYLIYHAYIQKWKKLFQSNFSSKGYINFAFSFSWSLELDYD